MVLERSDPTRITAFTDGVMAVAITLLVLNIEVPTVPDSELASSLDELITPLGAYALSFALVGRFWIIHHRLFEMVQRFDGPLMAMNLLFLALIALVPFSTNLLSDYSEVPEAAAVFGATIGLASLTNWGMAVYTRRRAFVPRHGEHLVQPFGSRLGLVFSFMFFVSMPVAYVSTTLAMALWVSAIFVRYPLRLVAGRVDETS
jgi:uncharacterized membrane protein